MSVCWRSLNPLAVAVLDRADDGRLLTGPGGAVAAAESIGGPVVLKAQAEGLVHKTEVGAVRLDLRSTGDLRAAYREVVSAFADELTGV